MALLRARLDGLHGQIRIGSQDDESFFLSVVEEMGGLGLVLDDGSHLMRHVRKSLEVFLPRMSDGGAYFIEDLHTAYWPSYGGSHHFRHNIFNIVQTIIDDLHHWYHQRKIKLPHISQHCRSIHIHDSIIVLEKGEPIQPFHSVIG